MLTWCRVLDSGTLLSPAYGSRLRLHVDNRSLQYRDLRHTIPLPQGVYHFGWVGHIPVAQPRAG
jgi:hypothetical protein